MWSQKIKKVVFWNILSFLTLVLVQPASAAEKNPDFFSNNSAQYQKILVKRVTSADTIILDNDERIRLIGLNAPRAPRRHDVEKNEYGFVVESDKPWDTVEEQALDFVIKLVEGKYVRLEFDEQRKDENSVNTAYVFLVSDNTFVNAEILRQGFAQLQLQALNNKYTEILRKAYQEAHTEKRGLQSE